MKKYTYTIINNGCENTYTSTSRNSVQHLQDHGGQKCIVRDAMDRIVSAAERFEDGTCRRIVTQWPGNDARER